MTIRRIALLAFTFTAWFSLGQLGPGQTAVNSAQLHPNTAPGQVQSSATEIPAPHYVLGPDDQVSIHALDVDDIDPTKPIKIDLHGFMDVPIIGKVKAAGLTVEQLERQLTENLAKYVRNPQVSLTVADYHSQPFSVVGAVNTPGVYSFTGENTLVQAISRAGGLRPDAGNAINLTRRSGVGPVPLSGASMDASGGFSTVKIDVRALLDAKDPQNDILVKPGDVISVPKADMVYVVGAVKQAGSFPLSERQEISVLQAVSMAQGLDKGSSPKHAKILRGSLTAQRTEIPVDVSKILSGKAADMSLMANDVLFIPTSATKNAGIKIIEAALSAGTLAGGYAAVH